MDKESTEVKLNRLKAEVEKLLSDFRHSAQHHRNTSQSAGEHNSSSTWHQGSSDAYRRVSERIEDWQQTVNQLVDELITQEKNKSGP